VGHPAYTLYLRENSTSNVRDHHNLIQDILWRITPLLLILTFHILTLLFILYRYILDQIFKTISTVNTNSIPKAVLPHVVCTHVQYSLWGFEFPVPYKFVRMYFYSCVQPDGGLLGGIMYLEITEYKLCFDWIYLNSNKLHAEIYRLLKRKCTVN